MLCAALRKAAGLLGLASVPLVFSGLCACGGGVEGAQMCAGAVMGALVVLRGVWVPDVRAGGALSKAALVTKRQSAEIAF